MKNDCSVIILAAGSSSRMGSSKFLLNMPDGCTFIENIIRQYADFGCVNIVIALNKAGLELINSHPQNVAENTHFVLVDHPEFGRFYSLKVGLKHIMTNFAFIHNADNPFAKKYILNNLYKAKTQADIIKPVINHKGGHPILISKQVRNDILLENRNNLNLSFFLKKYNAKYIPTQDESILFNINTYDEYLEFYRSQA